MNGFSASTLAASILAIGFTATVGRAEAPGGEPETVQIGFEQRVRTENWNNIFDFSGDTADSRSQIRLRSRLWTIIPAGSSVELHFGVGSESNERRGQPREFGELYVETAYVHMKRLFVNGLSLKVGRQDLVRGDGFIFADSTPYDGSRSFYSNAAILGYTRGTHTLELIALLNPARDHFLPQFHSQSRMLQEANESAAALYYSGAFGAGTRIDTYYLLKNEAGSIVTHSDSRYLPDRTVTVAGGRLVRRQGKWTGTVEGGYQFGTQSGNIPIRARGAIGSLRRVLHSQHKLYALGGFESLSGDDPSTPATIEGWDPMFARFVRPSELYLYSGLNERGLGNWSNLGVLSAEMGADVGRLIKVKGTWNRMTAPQPYAGTAAIFGAGKVRGNNFQARVDFRLPEGWKAHVLLERMLPGNFYSHRSDAWFLRFETSVQFKTANVLGFHSRRQK